MFSNLGGSGAILAVLLGLVAVVVVVGLFVAGVYNRLVALRNRYKNAFSQVDVQLKRRYDLIPNLVETVRGYMSHERGTLEAVVEARNQAAGALKAAAANPGDASSVASLASAEGALNGALGRLFAVAEAYPDLKANQNMLALQEELSSTESKVASARQTYNDAVTQYNTRRELFPDVLFAGMLGFTEARLFELDSEKERQAPRVSFS